MPRSFRRGLACVAIIGLVGIGRIAFAYVSPGAPRGYVNDFANVLTPEQETALVDKLHIHKEQTSNQIGVVTVPTTGDETIETYAVKLFEEWGIGRKDYDNGALLLVAVADRKVRIEVGYGLESVLTDARSARLIAQAIPLLREEKYPEAIEQLTDQMISTSGQGEALPAEAEATLEAKASSQETYFFIGFLFFLLVSFLAPIFWALYFVKRRRGWRYAQWEAGSGSTGESFSSTFSGSSNSDIGSSSSSSSSDSFGGGSSGGGGASGSW